MSQLFTSGGQSLTAKKNKLKKKKEVSMLDEYEIKTPLIFQ